MHSDSSDLSLSASGSQLLAVPPLSSIGTGDDDLSVSELSLSDRTVTFLKSNPPPTPTREEALEEEDVESKRASGRTRENKLQNDLFILKNLNASMTLFNEALDSTGSANERIAQQLAQTDLLLNKYIKTLSRTEDFARLIFDDEWHGADADEEIIMQERREAEEKARQEAEERVLATRRERERLEREAQTRHQQEEKERLERERTERLAARGGIRGVRGTRASMRGMRGAVVATREAPTTARGRIAVQTTTGRLTSAAGRASAIPGRGVRRS
ncbi:uncharacterized protein BT62DRAFT_928224 [Guyanagaster necrorhizus]|uniref:DASH complex subunit DUO1 n=1 Tax=Guyanagaster necrorhizus TaxID=856835 RepID=A0A9P7VZA1_9AGAR|nr:uncharacterized protein BT62DRAFT_928224 [Guyanagaster necrorhizus MCA 3950]KAG7449500.1 hypothetical protein BT62DRAFT_928224 [Guyanagaster necrorhizus MCA 3950]